MHLIQVLLPLSDNTGRLSGGLTAYMRGPAEGLWAAEGEASRDDIVVRALAARRL